MQMGCMWVANSRRFSSRIMARSLALVVGSYEGWTSIVLAPVSWKGRGSLVLPSSHSPALMRMSLTGRLNCICVTPLPLGIKFLIIIHPLTQLAEVKTNSSPMMAPPQSRVLLDSRRIMACQGISAKFASRSLTPVGFVLQKENRGGGVNNFCAACQKKQ